jgi:mono/diheme cytochrome c family protein
MRRAAVLLALLTLVLAAAAFAGGCGGGEEVSPTPETVEGTLPEEEEAAEGDAEGGKTVFASAGCGGCHVLADANSSGAVGPNLDESKPSEELVIDRVTNGMGAMPSFKDQLSEQEIADVAAYVSQAAGG